MWRSSWIFFLIILFSYILQQNIQNILENYNMFWARVSVANGFLEVYSNSVKFHATELHDKTVKCESIAKNINRYGNKSTVHDKNYELTSKNLMSLIHDSKIHWDPKSAHPEPMCNIKAFPSTSTYVCRHSSRSSFAVISLRRLFVCIVDCLFPVLTTEKCTRADRVLRDAWYRRR